MRTSARTSDGRLVLNGTKTFVNNGEVTRLICSLRPSIGYASTGKHPALSFWLVPHDLPGIKVYPVQKIGQSILPFFHRRVRERPLGRAVPFARKSRPGFRSCSIYRGSAGCSRAPRRSVWRKPRMEDAVAYARTRTAFGTQIANFQQIEQMLTDMEVKLDTCATTPCTRTRENSTAVGGDRLGVALMKRYVPEAATEVASDAMQIFGGRGYTRNERVSSIWQDCRGFQMAEGDRPDHGVRRGTAHHGRSTRRARSRSRSWPLRRKTEKEPCDHKTRSRRGSFSFGRLSTRSALMQSTMFYPYRSNCWSHFRNQGLIL